MIDILKMDKETKVLLVEMLKAGTITKEQANRFTDYCAKNELINQVNIVFTDFKNDRKDID